MTVGRSGILALSILFASCGGGGDTGAPEVEVAPEPEVAPGVEVAPESEAAPESDVAQCNAPIRLHKVEPEGTEVEITGPESTEAESIETATAADFGDASDGELYLAADEELVLEEGVYNFSNVTTEVGSLLTIDHTYADAPGSVRINSLGVCSFFGDLIYQGYGGSLIISCYSSIALEGNIDNADGSIMLVTASGAVSVADQPSETGGGAVIGDDPGTIDGDSTGIVEPIVGDFGTGEFSIDDGDTDGAGIVVTHNFDEVTTVDGIVTFGSISVTEDSLASLNSANAADSPTLGAEPEEQTVTPCE